MFSGLIEALILAIWKIIKGEVKDASKPVKGTDLGPPPSPLHARWADRMREYLRDKKPDIR